MEEVEMEKAEKAEKKWAAAAKVKAAKEWREVGIKCVTAIEDEMQKQIMNACQIFVLVTVYFNFQLWFI